MALIKCKECGEQISSKAKSCPKCGVTLPRKTSILTWLVLLVMIYAAYVINNRSTPHSATASSSSVSSTTSTERDAVKIEPPQKPEWETSTAKDKMTGEISAYATSPIAISSVKMSFPYTDVKAWLGVGCDKKDEWVYIGFSSSPNLANTETQSGYSLISTRIKWNDSIEQVALTQDWSSDFLHFREDKSALSKIQNSKTAMIELQWHGQQPTYFEFSLNGSSKAIAEIKKTCGK